MSLTNTVKENAAGVEVENQSLVWFNQFKPFLDYLGHINLRRF
jgi:hypothetical protein